MKGTTFNPLKFCYEYLWVPIFGRLLMLIVSFIEGKKPTNIQTYDLRTKDPQGKSDKGI